MPWWLTFKRLPGWGTAPGGKVRTTNRAWELTIATSPTGLKSSITEGLDGALTGGGGAPAGRGFGVAQPASSNIAQIIPVQTRIG
ncbi:MAG: hypothetical protein ABSG59_11530 [Verrucomicrobiota bacterium]